MLIDRAATIIRNERLNAASALAARARRDLGALRRGAGQLSARAQGRRRRRRRPAVHEPAGRRRPAELFKELEGPLVLVADEITPSVIAQLDWQRLAALVTDAGSWTYHTAILARSIHVPAVAGLRDASALIAPGRAGRGGGLTGEVFVEPDADTLAQVTAGSGGGWRTRRRSTPFRDLPPVTEDGVADPARGQHRESRTTRSRRWRRRRSGHRPVSIGVPARWRRTSGADRRDAQYDAYRRLMESAAPGRVTIRTFDVSESQLRLRHAAVDGARAPLGLRGHPPEPRRWTTCSRRSCGRCCARRCTGRSASCSRSSRARTAARRTRGSRARS